MPNTWLSRCSILLGLIAGLFGVTEARAQSPDWTMVVMAPAFPSPFISEWQRNPQNLTVTVVHSGQEPREFQLEGIVREARRGEMARAESGPLFVDGLGTLTYSAADLGDWSVRLAQSTDVDAAVRSGAIPEGDYELCVHVLTPQRIQLAEDCARFTIGLPDAPQLVYPGPGDPLLGVQPSFQWTPVLLPPAIGTSYRLTITPRRPGQTPQAALQANPPHHEVEVANAPYFIYPTDALPLAENEEYVWQVEALDGMGQPLVPWGLVSEIWTFRPTVMVGPGPVADVGALPDTVELVPGVARLTGLRSASARETPFGYALNGSARIEILEPFTADARVRLQDLELDGVGQPMRVRSGQVLAQLSASAVPEHLRGRFTLLDRLEYTPENGLTLYGTLNLPGAAGEVQLSGRAQVTAAGLYGVLEGSAPSGEALIELGGDPVSLRVRAARVTLPSGQVELDGTLDVFSGVDACGELSGALDAEGFWIANVVCAPDLSLPLAAGAGRAEVRLNSIVGEIAARLGDGAPDFRYDLAVNSRLRLDEGGTDGCSALIGLALVDGDVSVRNATPRCDPAMGAAALDWLEFAFANFRIDDFGYRPGNGFDFAFRVDIDPSVLGDIDLPLPTIPDVGISRDGLSFPAFEGESIGGVLDLAGYQVRIERVGLPAFTLGWDAWQSRSAEAFDFELDLSVAMPELVAAAPTCPLFGALPVASARLSGGSLTLALTGTAVAEPAGCRIALADDLAFEIERLGGEFGIQLAPQLALDGNADVQGRLILPDLFRCTSEGDRGLAVTGGLGLGPSGQLVGTLRGVAPDCPADFGAVALTLTEATLELGGTPDDRIALLSGQGAATFSGQEQVAGSGEVTLDLISGRIVEGELHFAGPFRFDLPRDEPLLSFSIGEALLDREGLHVDGRNVLLLDDEQITTTFRNVVFDPTALRISAGEVLFDAPFVVDAGLSGDGGVRWRAADPASPFSLESGARIALPVEIRLDANGLRAEGSAGARLVFENRDLTELSATFADDFVLGFEPVAVHEGIVELRQDGVRLAWVDATGFHVELAYLGRELLPERLGVPNVDLAYLQLIDSDGSNNVETETTPEGLRIYTAPGRSLPLVLPAFASDGASAPELAITVDLTLDPLGDRVVAGGFSVDVPSGSVEGSPFDLSTYDVPFIVTHIAYGMDDLRGEPRLALGGQLRLLDETIGQPGSVALELTPGGRLEGSFDIPAGEQYALVTGSDRLNYAIDRLSGEFDIDLGDAGVRRWTIDHEGELHLALGTGTPYAAAATLRASNRGFEFTDIETAGGPGRQTFDLGPVRLGVERVTIPRLGYTPAEGWDFDIDFDLTLAFPELGALEFLAAREVRLNRDGLQIPALHAPELGAEPFELAGFSVRPLAFRMDAVHLDVFGTGEPVDGDWGFAFDVEIALRDLPDAAPVALRHVQVTALDVGYRNGRFTGEVEPFVLADPIRLPAGPRDMAMELRRLAGALREVDGTQEIELVADSLLWVAPDFMRCDSDSGTLPVGGGFLRMTSRGAVSGTITDLAPTCPLRLGPLALQATEGELTFDYAPGERGRVELGFAATARLPGLVEGDTITAQGSLRMDLIDLVVLDGRIEITDPFRWDLPVEHPFLRFTVERGHIDRNGLVLTGDGGLRLEGDGGPAMIDVTFDELALGFDDFRIRGGSARIASDFALDVTLEQTALQWAARPATSPRPENDGFRLVIPNGATLDAQGLGLEGEASAQLAVAGEEFPALRAVFADDFRIGTGPVSVEAGRAGFWLDETEIAHVDRSGFWLGDLFAIAEIPDRLPLPDTAVAYIQLRDPNSGEVLVSSESIDGTIRLRGSGLGLVVPGLRGSGDVPEATISLDVAINPATLAVVSGSIEATGSAGQSLFGLTERFGLPLELHGVRYADDGDGYRLTGDARVTLPRALSDIPAVEVRQFAITEDGPVGEVRLGSFRSDYSTTEAALSEHDFGGVLALRIEGLQADLGARTLDVAGAVTLTPFADRDGNRTPIHFNASAGAGGTLGFAAAADSLAGGALDFGAATFAPTPIDGNPGLALEVSDNLFAVRLAGVLKVPSLGDDFAVTVRGMEVATTGVRLDEATLDDEQAFQLFGATFTLKQVDDSNDPILSLAYDDSAHKLELTMSGEVELPFFDQTSSFRGLRVTSAGEIALAQANLLSRPVTIIEEVLVVDSLTIAENRLHFALGVDLPEPLQQEEMQRVRFSLGTDGSVEGGGTVSLLGGAGETPRRPVSSIATIHLRHLDLELRGGGSQPNARLRAVAQIELAGEIDNRIDLGYLTGGEVYPGLTLDFREGLEWGNVRMQDSIRTPIEVVYLTLHEIAVIDDPLGLSLGFGGTLGFDLPGIRGGVNFTDFRLTPLAFAADFGSISVTGGHLGLADLVTLELNNFAFSGTPTTLEVASIQMPTSESPEGSSGTETVAVSSYIDFGGRISVGCSGSGQNQKCIASGGVERFQFYRTAGDAPRTSFLVRRAELEIGDLLDMNADLRFNQGEGSTFELLLAASATIMSEYSATVVGMFDNTGDATRAGLFAAVGATIPIAPPLILAEVGGGFFLNPRPEHIALVREYAGFEASEVSAPTGSFTGILYGRAIVGSEEVANGRVLLTASEAGAQLSGNLLLLGDAGFGGDPLAQGSFDVAVGFKEKYVEGNMQLDVAYGPIVSGSGRMEFYVYGSDAWGVMGNARLRYLSIVEGQAGFFVGAPGFMVNGNIRAGFDFWIVSVNAEMDASMWYQVAPMDLGAYMRVAAEASLLGGALRGEGELRGAMLAGGGESPFIYAGALAQGCAVVIGCAEANIWAKFQNGRVNGGFGKDPTMDQIIARANDALGGMADARDAAVENIEESRPMPGSLGFSDEELAQIYANLDRTEFGIFGSPASRTLADARAEERRLSAYSLDWDYERAYYDWYSDLVLQKGIPQRPRFADPDPYLDNIRRMQPEVAAQLASIEMDLLTLEQIADEPWPESPVGMVSFERPRTTTTDADGNVIKVLAQGSGPSFAVDAQASASSRAELETRRAATDAMMEQIRAQLTALEAGVASVEAPLEEFEFMSIEPTVQRFALEHATALQEAERRFAEQGDFLLRLQDWYDSSLSSLRESQMAILFLTSWKTDALSPLQVRNLARARLAALDELRGHEGRSERMIAFDRAVSQLPSGDPWFEEQANDLGMELWYELALVGMEAEYEGADSALVQLRREHPERLEQIRAQHLELTRRLNEITTRKTEVLGSLYDLYDRYAYWLGTIEESESDIAAERTRVASRMARLDRHLTVPAIVSAEVTTTNRGYLADTRVQVEASHPSGVYEFLFNDVSGEGGDGLSGLLTSGPFNVSLRTSLIPDRGTTSETRTVTSGARGGAGFVGVASTEYTINYQQGGGGPNSSTSISLAPDLSPPSRPVVQIRSGHDWVSTGGSAWTVDASRIELRWSASDPHSGIAEYEYAVGWPGDTTAVRGWTSVGGRTEIAVHGLDLRDGENRVFVRARNGAGMVSPVGISAPIRYDSTPPTFGDGEFEIIEAARPPLILEPSIQDLNLAAIGACVLPTPSFAHQPRAQYQPPRSQRSAGTRQLPYLTIRPPTAVDAESDIAAYYWRLDDEEPTGGYTEYGWNEAPTQRYTIKGRGTIIDHRPIEIPAEMLDFDREFYLSVVAINGAGLQSEPVIHPFRIADPTPPTATRFCVMQHSSAGQLGLAFSSAARDLESGIAGYQYRIRGEDGTIVRDWPTDHFDFTDISAGQIVPTAPASLVDGDWYYVDVRVSNGQGAYEYVTSGPIRLDYSPPPKPSATVTRVIGYTGPVAISGGDGLFDPRGSTSLFSGRSSIELDVQVTIPDDPESGLQVIQWEVVPHFDRSSSELTPELQIGGAQEGGSAAGSGTGGPLGGLLGGGAGTGGSASPTLPHGVIPGAPTGTYTVRLTSEEMRQLNLAEPGSRYELRLRSVNQAGVPSTTYRALFTLQSTRGDDDGDADSSGRRERTRLPFGVFP